MSSTNVVLSLSILLLLFWKGQIHQFRLPWICRLFSSTKNRTDMTYMTNKCFFVTGRQTDNLQSTMMGGPVNEYYIVALIFLLLTNTNWEFSSVQGVRHKQNKQYTKIFILLILLAFLILHALERFLVKVIWSSTPGQFKTQPRDIFTHKYTHSHKRWWPLHWVDINPRSQMSEQRRLVASVELQFISMLWSGITHSLLCVKQLDLSHLPLHNTNLGWVNLGEHVNMRSKLKP